MFLLYIWSKNTILLYILHYYKVNYWNKFKYIIELIYFRVKYRKSHRPSSARRSPLKSTQNKPIIEQKKKRTYKFQKKSLVCNAWKFSMITETCFEIRTEVLEFCSTKGKKLQQSLRILLFCFEIDIIFPYVSFIYP